MFLSPSPGDLVRLRVALPGHDRSFSPVVFFAGRVGRVLDEFRGELRAVAVLEGGEGRAGLVAAPEGSLELLEAAPQQPAFD